jgi:hypothetical protein
MFKHFVQVLMESTNGGRPGGPGGVTNGTNGESHAANGVENGRVMAQVGESRDPFMPMMAYCTVFSNIRGARPRGGGGG